MGLLLLIPGLVLLFNGTEWFKAEDNVGMVLTVVGAVLVVIQLLWLAHVNSRVEREFNRSW